MNRLAGRRVLILRPRVQAERFAQLVAAAEGLAVPFPTLEILPAVDAAALDAVLTRLEEFDTAIFVSPNAVEHGLNAVRERGLSWPTGLRCAVVGEGTGGALRRAGFRDVLAPRGGADSEALAALAEMQDMSGRRVVIFRGEGGREWLASTLAVRGARIDYAQCYRRVIPDADTAPVVELLGASGVHAICVWSSEAWANFLHLLGVHAALAAHAPVFVPHPRVAAAVAASGARAIVAEGGESGMLCELESYFAGV